ncbi:multidrug effflux MFS transporter [Nitrincola alkalisediminis]|uniref:multidrug effflux MFS transporter n=1 Tax=Nitrincola alkalisediminis TaxID=1366656 RepID=UPI001876FEAF|nr:multidrug effflux MFS transporter [Nitrincola alkalisediminis]
MTTTNQKVIPGLVWMLAALTALAPLSIDAYLPAFPLMAEDLHVSVHDIELTLSVFLGGFALGQLTGGPISDHWGRRAAIVCGLSIFSLGSIGIILSDSIGVLWGSRFLQALGGGISVVNSAAIVRDLYRGADSARAMSRIAAIMMVAPMLAPALGSLLLMVTGWRSIFILLQVYCLILLWVLWVHLPETRRHDPNRLPLTLAQRYREIILHKKAMGYLLSVAFGNGGMFAFITGSATVYLTYYSVSTAMYPLLFGANVLMILVCNQINARIVHIFGPQKILLTAQAAQVIIGIITLLCILLTPHPLSLLIPLIIMFMGLQGFVMSNGMSCTVEFFPHSAASATALTGAAGFTLGAFAGAAVGLLGDGTPLPMVSVMTGAVGLGLSTRYFLHRTP